MDADMKRIVRKNAVQRYFFYISLIAVTAFITALIMVLLSGEESKSRMEIEYEAEQTAALVVEEYLAGRLENPSVVDDRIRGLGIYNPDGSGRFVWGNAPESFSGSVQPPGKRQFSYSKDGDTLTLVRGIGAPRMMWRMMRRYMKIDENLPAFEAQPVIYMVFDASGHFARSRSASSVMGVIPLVTILCMVAIGVLYAKNLQYRKKLANQSELEKLGEIARTLAHEIKNPLGAMQIHIGYLRKTLPEDVHAELGVLDEEISRLNLLTHRISDFVRDPVGNPEEIDLAYFADEMAERYGRNVRVTKERGEAFIVRFDRERIHSVIENLVTNGLESYEKRGEGIETPVEIAVSREKGRIVLSVMDRGSGIDTEAEGKVFDPFFSTKTKGSGIGLAISKRFVEAAGGTLELRPRDGGGTVARVVFRREGRDSAHSRGR